MAERNVLAEVAAWIKDKTTERDAAGVIVEEGIDVDTLPAMESFIWIPQGHPNAASPFRTAEGFPIAIRMGQPWPLAPYMTVIFGFSDDTEIRLYALPNKDQAGPGEILQPKRYTLDKSRFVITTQIMSFETWRNLLTADVATLAAEGFDEDEDEEEDEPTNGQAVPATGARAPGPSAAAGS